MLILPRKYLILGYLSRWGNYLALWPLRPLWASRKPSNTPWIKVGGGNRSTLVQVLRGEPQRKGSVSRYFAFPLSPTLSRTLSSLPPSRSCPSLSRARALSLSLSLSLSPSLRLILIGALQRPILWSNWTSRDKHNSRRFLQTILQRKVGRCLLWLS